MNSCFNEDETLMLLNDINITEEDLSDDELTDIEKRKLKTDIMGKIKPKISKRKKWTIAAAIAFTAVVSIPLVQTDVFAKMLSKLAVVPGIGEIMMNDKGLALKNSITDNDVTLNNMYIDQNKIVVTLSVKSKENYYESSYSVKDDKGNTYKLKVNDSSGGDIDNITTYKAEYTGKVKKASKYTLSVMNHKASFTLKNSDFAEVSEAQSLYTATNGKTTVNITSVKRDGDILKVAYYVTDSLNHYSTAPSFNVLTFKEEEECKKKGLEPRENGIQLPYFELYDEYGNKDFGHISSSHLTYENESLFNLKKLKGKKLKLTLPSVTYHMGNNFEARDFKVELDVPKQGKTMLNRIEEFNGFKYKIVSIERLSDRKIALQYNFINDSSSKLQAIDMGLDGDTYGGSSDYYEGNFRNIMTSENSIGDKFELNNISIGYASVGPFEFELDLDKIK